MLEVGKKYKCKNGQTAVITDEGFDPIYSFSGKILNADGTIDFPAFWLPNGRWRKEVESEYDIENAR